MSLQNLGRRVRPPTVSLIFPTYNPGEAVKKTWRKVQDFLAVAPGDWEVLFVCDGCTDGTPARLEEMTRDYAERVRVIAYEPNRGKGHAVRRGLAEATGLWRVFTDVDLAYSFDDVLALVRELQAGRDVVIASRLHRDSQVIVPVRLQGYAHWRQVQSRVFATLVQLLLPLKMPDTQAGLKGFSAGAAERLLPHLRCDGFGFDCEMLVACVKLGLPVTEMPVCVRYDSAVSTTGVRSLTRMVLDLWRIRRTWRGFVPPPSAPASSPPAEAA